MNFDRMRQKLSDEYIIAFRGHYLVANSFNFKKYEGFVYDVSKTNDINKLYIASDLLITDYSSVFFDFANLKRPMIFYMYDFCKYENDTRGFYIDVDELPGPLVKTTNKLIEAIKSIDVDNFECDEKYLAFNNKYNYLDDGQASKRVVKRIIG
jgi:CDP-glycerol glycerophosphotransferase